MRIVYTIFPEDGSIVLTEGGEKISLTPDMACLPICCYSGSSLVVYLNEGRITEASIVPLRDYIKTILEDFLEDGLVRIDFSDWHTMVIYSVDAGEGLDSEERYKNVEDLLENFLAYRGPNILV